MKPNTYQPSDLAALGNVLRKAALESQAIIDAIPEDADVEDEATVIELAIRPVDALAGLILRMPGRNGSDNAIRSQAQAWMDGNYWATVGATS